MWWDNDPEVLPMDHDGPCNDQCERWCDKWVNAHLGELWLAYDAADNRVHRFWQGIPLKRDSDSFIAEFESRRDKNQ